MGKGGVSTTALVSALRGILEPTVTSAPREWLGMDAQRRVAGKRAPTVVDVSQTVAVSVWRVGVVRIARDARRATLEMTVKQNATRSRLVEATDVAGQTGLVSALKPLQGPAVTCVRRASGAKAARWNARLTQPAWITEGVLGMEVVYAHRDSLERAVTCAMLTCTGKAVTSRAHALGQGGVWGMVPANVHMDGWERRALSVM